MIHVESTRYSHVVTCTNCPGWSEGADSHSDGARIGARHEDRAHSFTTVITPEAASIKRA